MREENLKHGAFGWVELVTSDQQGATDFYKTLFGWETEAYPMEGMDYTVVKVDGEPVGGIMPKPAGCEDRPSFWGVYVTVDDVDATAAQVEQLGGKILCPPTNIPEIGRFCAIQDPQGAPICAITYVKK